MSADIVSIAAELGRSIQATSRALGSALVLALAFSTVVWSVLSLKLGKRPVSTVLIGTFEGYFRKVYQYLNTEKVFLASTLLMFGGAMISSFSKFRKHVSH